MIVVPLFRRLQLGAVLGYLAAGAIIGPWGFGLIGDAEATLSIAELGVVLLLFLVGLELEPSRLWALRQPVFGLGGAQVLLTGIAITAITVALGQSWQAAIVIGFGLAMSSTAIVLAWLGERGELSSPSGRRAFAILLFQDLAVIPLIALLPLLGPDKVSGASGLLLAAKGVGAIVFVIVVSRLVIRPALKLVARFGGREVFTAAALLVVIGAALLMEAIGLSMSLGAFLAGVLLADSEFRHELEADVDPFKGLLLGLFFMAVGMSANLSLLAAHPVPGAWRGARLDGREGGPSLRRGARRGIRQRRSAAHRRAARARRRIRVRAVPGRAKRGHPQRRVGGVPRAGRDRFHAGRAAVVCRA